MLLAFKVLKKVYDAIDNQLVSIIILYILLYKHIELVKNHKYKKLNNIKEI